MLPRIIVVLAGGLGLLLCALAGSRMSSDAMGVVVGVVVGVGAMIPCVLLLVFVITRREPAQPPAPTVYIERAVIGQLPAGWTARIGDGR